MDKPEHISLKFGTLKSWNVSSEKGRALLTRYFELGMSPGAMTQHDTPEQKALICQLIDETSAPTIHLDWDEIDVTKEEAKKYVMEYGGMRT